MISSNPSCLTCKTRKCSLLNNCSNDILQEISDKKIFRQARRGEKIFTEGKEALNIAFVRTGILKVEMNGKNSRPLIIRLAKEGDIVGHRITEVFNQYPESVIAVENSQLCFLSFFHFQYLLEKSSAFRKQIINAYLDEMNEIETRTVHLVQKTVKEKIAGILLYIADVYKYSKHTGGIHIHLSRQDIADLTGTTKEQISTILGDFKKEKLINFRAKHFKYFNIQKLSKEAVVEVTS